MLHGKDGAILVPIYRPVVLLGSSADWNSILELCLLHPGAMWVLCVQSLLHKDRAFACKCRCYIIRKWFLVSSKVYDYESDLRKRILLTHVSYFWKTYDQKIVPSLMHSIDIAKYVRYFYLYLVYFLGNDKISGALYVENRDIEIKQFLRIYTRIIIYSIGWSENAKSLFLFLLMYDFSNLNLIDWIWL